MQSMTYNANCPKCGALLDLTHEMLGVRVECGVCALIFTTPADAPIAAPPPEPVKAKRVDRRELIARAERHRDPDPDDITPGTARRGQGKAITALVLGILAVTVGFGFSMIPFGSVFQSIIGVIAIIFGYLGIKTEGRMLAIAGMVMGVLGVLGSILMTVGYGICCYSLRTAAPPPPRPAPPMKVQPYTTKKW